MPRNLSPAHFPATRMRRVRQAPWVRALVREQELSPSDLIWALIVKDGKEPEPVPSMPGVERVTPSGAAQAAKRASALGVPCIAIFPFIDPAKKDETGSELHNSENVVMKAIKAIKDAAPEIGVMSDVALDPFTDHGHDGLMDSQGRILNDRTVDMLLKSAVMQAEAGCDIIAPSEMMDGRVAAIRYALEEVGQTDTLIMSYAAKYASAFYGPYRDAIGTARSLKGDKKTYQMDPANAEEALREVALDIAEGADMVMVKPGMPYLDVIQRVREHFAMPTYAFQVSGEYAMMKAAIQHGWLDEDRAILEALTCFKRAGAQGVITYFAEQAGQLLNA